MAASAVKQPVVSGVELGIVGHLNRQGWLRLPPEAGKALLQRPSRWRAQLLEWDGKPLDVHRAEFRANAQTKPSDRIPQRWPVDRLIVNTGEQLHTRLARCDHMNAPLDKSPVVRVVDRRGGSSGTAKETFALRCITCQRMSNRFDTDGHIQAHGDGSIELQFTRPAPIYPRATLYDATSRARLPLSGESINNLREQGQHPIPLDPFRFSGPCVIGLIERFPTLPELNEIPPAQQSAGPRARARLAAGGEGGWICTNPSCDPSVVNATDLCSSCGTHRSWIERSSR